VVVVMMMMVMMMMMMAPPGHVHQGRLESWASGTTDFRPL
jgi:hypothetical protein